jgi:hypothetical protein
LRGAALQEGRDGVGKIISCKLIAVGRIVLGLRKIADVGEVEVD